MKTRCKSCRQADRLQQLTPAINELAERTLQIDTTTQPYKRPRPWPGAMP